MTARVEVAAAPRGVSRGTPAPSPDGVCTPYAGLTPDRVLDALESVGLRGDGRLLALNSYENRVYLVHLEERPPVVAKFYRAGRWSDAQVLEEHAFVASLAEREIPVVSALALAGGRGAPAAAPR
jgi:Ser/Thr protein kinase RdoA (MazF antagonist)